MAAMKLLIAHARRHCQTKPPIHLSINPLLGILRSFSSSLPPESDSSSVSDESLRRTSQSVPIQPTSYPIKPKDQAETTDVDRSAQSPLPPRARQSANLRSQETPTTWTREDFRYVKDVPEIAPVSYPTRVAPLPDDRISGEAVSGEEKGSGGVEEERKRIQADNQFRRNVFRLVEEEKTVIPFPSLVKVEKKGQKLVLELTEAIRQVKANAKGNFDETVEAHARLGVDARKMQVLGNMTLPHSVGKTVKVAFFAEGIDADDARAAGADIVGGVELIEEIASSRKFNVDKCFSTPEMMRRIGKISKILRQRGLLPDPKLGTVTSDVAGALKKAREGHMHFKMDSTSIVHVGLGKASYSEDSLRENIGAFVNALLLAKPSGLKKASKYAGYLHNFHICSTMGPGFGVTMQSVSKAADQYNKKYLTGMIR